MTQIGQNMMLVKSVFRNVNSFTLIPVSLDSPYTEAMFDPASGILAVISKVMKQSYHMVPKLNDDGEPIRLKTPNQQWRHSYNLATWFLNQIQTSLRL